MDAFVRMKNTNIDAVYLIESTNTTVLNVTSQVARQTSTENYLHNNSMDYIDKLIDNILDNKANNTSVL